ncbi:MAG: hypothetical protein VB113_13380 [Acetobacterium wieringae]|nr:hypothetical protein [Acetobacterium wieringae]MEA4806855.1 hypothetical protein [Acetobacterium wieringae]
MAEPGSGAVKLTWDAVTGATGYKIIRATASNATNDDGYIEIATGVTNLSYDATGLEPGQRYYFKVIATAGAAVSPSSNQVTAIANVDDNGDAFVGNKLLVSNELTDPTAAVQSTGSLSINENSANLNVMGSGELDPEAYRINPVIPFEPVAGQEPVNYNMDGEMQVQATYVYGNTRSFIVDKKSESNPSTINGRCAYNGTNVQVWVDTAGDAKVKLTDGQAELIGKEFDSKIYSLVTNNFGAAPNVDGDGKIAILCFDIADTYNGLGTGYTAGFFYGGDLYKNDQLQKKNSNEMEIFYADTYPTMIKDPQNPVYNDPDVTKVYSTLAHEFQHMVNFNQNYLVEGEQKEMDTWLNEALSLAAEQMYNGTQTNRITYYNSSTAIQNGHSLLSWQNGSEVLANYSLSYLFSQYLRTQVDQKLATGESVEGGDAKIFNEIITNDQEDFSAVEAVITKWIDHDLTFGQFMTNFRAAMLLKADSGPYGFNNEEGFDTIITPLYTGGTIDLKGGGAVVKSITNEVKPTGKGANITYLGIYN